MAKQDAISQTSNTDLIVVGAGSAGCQLASKLASEHGFCVQLVEAPADQASLPDRQRPARWLNLLASCEDWNLPTQPNPQLSGRAMPWPRGRGLGGSSRINAMIWFPPTEQDFQTLIRASGGSWQRNELQQAYEAARNLVAPETPRWLSESAKRFLEATSATQNAEPMVYQRVNRRGQRWNPAQLLQATGQGSIEVLRGEVENILWDHDRAIGVRLRSGDSYEDLRSRHGVVLCAGTIGSPTILLRSGVGPRDSLKEHQVDVRVDCEHVGQHLQDHLIMPVIYETRGTPFPSQPSTRELARWQTMGQGAISSNLAECGGLFCDQKFQLHVTPTNYLTYPKQSAKAVMTLGISLSQPTSRGSLQLSKESSNDPPRIQTGYLSTADDREQMIQAVQFTRDLVQETSLASWVVRETTPGAKRVDEEAIGKAIARYSQTLYHPVGTNRLGPPGQSVVDCNFRVQQTTGLWVADASVLPIVTLGNPNSMVMTLALLASQEIREIIDQTS